MEDSISLQLLMISSDAHVVRVVNAYESEPHTDLEPTQRRSQSVPHPRGRVSGFGRLVKDKNGDEGMAMGDIPRLSTFDVEKVKGQAFTNQIGVDHR